MKNKIVELGYSSVEVDELLRVSKNIEDDYSKLLNKYPIQYLIGYVNFYGYNINVNESVLIPRYETELLVEKTIKYCKSKFNTKINILDLCTGSGAIAVALSKNIDSNVFASDISKDALKVAKNNAKINDCNINFIESDLFNNIDGKYDLIISNPPYISYDEEIMDSVKKYEPNIALFAKDNGLYFYKEIFKNAISHLNDKYILAFEIGYKQGNILKEEASTYFKNANIFVEKDYSNKDRFLFIISE